MRPTQHPSNNDVLASPPGVSIEECQPLAITRVKYEGGMDGVESYWEPTEAERQALAVGAKVRFTCWGQTHPPIWIGVDGVEAE